MTFWKKTLKYGNKRVEKVGYSFASGLESGTHDLLLLLEKAGEIKDLQVQTSVYLTRARILYKPDFTWTRVSTEGQEWGEAKGFDTAIWAIKKRLWKFYGPGPLHIYRGTRNRVFLDEVIIPVAKSG